jgi:hypothetical protein
MLKNFFQSNENNEIQILYNYQLNDLFELDIYIPDLKLALEYQGIYLLLFLLNVYFIDYILEIFH